MQQLGIYSCRRPLWLAASVFLINACATDAMDAMDPGLDEVDGAFHDTMDTLAADKGLEPDLALGDIHVSGDWAWAVARDERAHADMGEDGHDAGHPDMLVLLGQYRPDSGWQVVTSRDGVAFDQQLLQVPDAFIDGATKAVLTQARAKATYTGHRLPTTAGQRARVAKKNGSGHEYQTDFVMDDDNAIYATKPGKVVFVKESSSTNCTAAPPDPCWRKANMVVIQHDSGEYSWYVHLEYNSVPVELGSYVDIGTRIGTEGYTGYTYPANARHLHYMVSSGHTTWTDPSNPNDAPWATGISSVDFDEVSWASMSVYSTYYSQNASDPGAASWGNGHTDVFIHGEDNQLWYKRYYNGAWSGWQALGGTLMSAPDAASWGSGHMDVYVRGLDNNVYYRRYINGSWQDWVSIGAPPGGATSDPAAASQSSGTMDVFVRGNDKALWKRSYSGGSWASWQSLGGTLTAAPDASSWGSGNLDVVLRDANNELYTRRSTSGIWGAWVNLGGVLSDDPGAVSPASGNVYAFVRGVTKELWYREYSGGVWGAYQLLGGTLTSGADASSWHSNHVEVFVRGLDNNVYYRTENYGSWSGWNSLGHQ